MCLKLNNLFEVIYPTNYSEDKVKELKEIVDDLKIDNIVNISKKKRDNYFFVVSETTDTLDFRVSPIFEIIDPIKEINDIEESDYVTINDGFSVNNYENYNTNININLIDIKDNHLVNKLSIKKFIEQLNYPEELVGILQNDDYLETLYESEEEEADDEVQEAEADAEADVEVQEAEADAEADVEVQEAEADAEAEEECLRTVKITRESFFHGFDFQIIKNEKNKFIINNIVENGIAHNKLFNGDIIKTINKIKCENYTKIIRSLGTRLTINLEVIGSNKNKYNKYKKSSTTFYRIIGKTYLKLSLFRKTYNVDSGKYDKKNIKYITSIVLSENISYPKILDHDFDNSEVIEKAELFFNYEYYENYFLEFNELSYFYELLNNYNSFEVLNDKFFESVINIKSGVYFNINSIIWNLYLSTLLCSCVETDEISLFSHKHFDLKNIRQLYFQNYKKNKASPFEIKFVKNIRIVCDICNTFLSNNLSTKFYGNSKIGDLCEKCYNDKKRLFYRRIKYLKNLILMEGKRNIFNKELEKTKEFLNNYKIKNISKKQYYNLISNINSSLLVKETTKQCKICFELMDIDLCASTNCGHCFHNSCIEKVATMNCPACRVNTRYVKLYF